MTAPHFDGRQACAGLDTTLFFGGHHHPAAAVANERAKTICRTCIHIAACLEYALTVPIGNGRWVEGVWGATTTDERSQIRRRREQANPT